MIGGVTQTSANVNVIVNCFTDKDIGAIIILEKGCFPNI